MRELTSHLSFVIDIWTQSVVGRNLSVEEMNFALRAVATSFARVTSPEKNSWIIVMGN